jgi:hypothetical protein
VANTVLNGADKETSSAEGVVNNQGDTLLLTDLGDGLEVGDVVLGVSDGLDVDSLGVVVDGSSDVFGLVAVHELGLDSEPREHDLELVVGSSVQERGRHDVVTGVRESGNGHELGALAGGGGHSGNSSLQRGNTLLENIDCRLRLMSERVSGSGMGDTNVHDTAVDVAELLESKETRAMSGVVENEGLFDAAFSNSITPSRDVDSYRRGVDGDSSGPGGGVNILTVVQRSLAYGRTDQLMAGEGQTYPACRQRVSKRDMISIVEL